MNDIQNKTVAACRLYNCKIILTGKKHWDEEMVKQFKKHFNCEPMSQKKWWHIGYLTTGGFFIEKLK
jgi:UDP-N-acetylglucosamine 2-epimerase